MGIQAPFGAKFRPHSVGDLFLLAFRMIYLLLRLRLPDMSLSVVFHTFNPNTLWLESEISPSELKFKSTVEWKCIDIFTSSFSIYGSHILPPRSPVFPFAAISKLSLSKQFGSHVHVKLDKSSSFTTNKDWSSPPPSNLGHSCSLRGESCRKHSKDCCRLHLSILSTQNAIFLQESLCMWAS